MPANPRNYKQEYDRYHSKDDQLKNRASRNKARRAVTKAKGKAAVKGKDVDHKDGNPRNNSLANLRLQSKHLNRRRLNG
jgi:hypothetical protein